MSQQLATRRALSRYRRQHSPDLRAASGIMLSVTLGVLIWALVMAALLGWLV